MSIYKLKSSFQDRLRPTVLRLAAAGVTANQVTTLSAVISVLIGIMLWQYPARVLFLLIPLWMFLRMALNAIDGMLAREHGQKSPLGGHLNEIGDVVSDAALYAPFALVAPFSPVWIGAVIFLAALTEFAGVLGAVHGDGRRYDGPMGKSDRALVFGILGTWIAVLGVMPDWFRWILPIICVMMAWTVVNRIRSGIGS
ncbi:CDP-alcohol phosphatidyltransferase family protein [Paracoccus methylarcula]|uniref:CDP-alcohol phosphatidyltransferase family protein n=1 Tax=Paracoccus methylarcula TaxID=72022 RepID=A0A3R7PR29_9RHOB|nr:CDP-alcohol phosphatidyltransferase family protein [Paracoccus methylarcula]RNF35693.1 CDP-alcohol phosphatidyltransferase family protein [Paracoccus methylarcula]